MATNYKILGQVQASSAGATQNLNIWPDPNFEYYPGSHTSGTGSSHVSPIFQAWQGSNWQSNEYVTYEDGDGYTVGSRSDSVRFNAHHHNGTYHWINREANMPYLDASKVYTLSLWYKGYSDGHWNKTFAWSKDNAANWNNIESWGSNGDAHSQTNNRGYLNTWKQYYTTFSGTNSYFRLYYRSGQYNSNGWNRFSIDNVYLTEGAIPQALIPYRAPDGSTGNPNIVYAAPFTVRSEGWSGDAYNSSTIRKLTGAWQTLYTVPDTYQAVASTISIVNISATLPATYRIAVVKYGESLTHKHLLAFDQPIAVSSNESYTVGMTLSAGDRVLVQSDTDRVQFSLFGSELTP